MQHQHFRWRTWREVEKLPCGLSESFQSWEQIRTCDCFLNFMSSSKIFFSWGQQLDPSFYQILWNFTSSFSFFWWHPSTFHFQEIIKNKKEDFVLQNEEASVKYCQVKLDEISKTLMESILKDTFCSWRLWTLQESKGKIWTGLSSSAQKRSEGKYT